MYKWKLEIILNSGKELTVYYSGNEDNSAKVAEKILTGNKDDLNGFNNEDGTKHIFVKLGDISAVSISIA